MVNTFSSESGRKTVALLGNPNSGKTVIFNALVGARQHVGNYPGVTVEKANGTLRRGELTLDVVDLPGTYSLSPYSVEEQIARGFLIDDAPDVVINVVDASNIERNLYLTVQLLELGVPLVIALNMSDVAKNKGMKIDVQLLETLLGTVIVPTVGHKGEGIKDLLNTAVKVAGGERRFQPRSVTYGEDVEQYIHELQELLKLHHVLKDSELPGNNLPVRWVALKLLEGDEPVQKAVGNEKIISAADVSSERLEATLGDSAEAIIAEKRYGFISGACQETLCRTVESRRLFSEKIDVIATNRVLGLPIFFGLMYVVFNLTFTLGEPPMVWIESGIGVLKNWVDAFWAANSESLLRSLLVDGIISGVGGVIIFLPNILLLFLAIAFLEDSGYMARAAFLMDRLMHKIGLHGKSFIPMLIGFGCSVPAIMATRTLENRKDRLTTMIVVPLMSCGARLPIYALIIPVFFPEEWRGATLWFIYIIGVVLAIICAKILRKTLFKGDAPPFVMELPPYRFPTIKSVSMHMWNRGGAYLKKAGTVILAISIILWGLQQWPGLPDAQVQQFAQAREQVNSADSLLSPENKEKELTALDYAEAEATLESSLMGRLGKKLEVVLAPCGFDWRISTAMVGAFAAKEVFVSQLGIVYSLGSEQDEESDTLREQLRANYSPLQGFCIMLFCLISAPCMATVAITRRESNSWKWALFQLAGLTVLAWVVTAIVYQVGTRLI